MQSNDKGLTAREERPSRWHFVAMGVIALAFISLDQYTKALVRANIPPNTSEALFAWLEPIVTLTHVHNTGAAFGILQGLSGLFAFAALAVVVMILVWFRRLASSSWFLTVAFGLQLAGAIGNLIDRLSRGYVTDFIDLHWWPVFNVADSCIVVGTILLGIYIFFLDDERWDEALARGESAPDSGAELEESLR